MQSDRLAHQADRQKYIKGEHVHTIFHNEQEQFSIAKIKIHETNEHYKYKEIVAKGYFPHLQDGTVYYFYGDLKKHPSMDGNTISMHMKRLFRIRSKA